MSSGDAIIGTHSLDLLSIASNNEILTAGTYGSSGAYMRLYQQNNINNGIFFGLSNNNAALWRPDGTRTTLDLDGTLVTSNITTKNASNNIYFSNSTLYGVCNLVLGGSIFDLEGKQIKLGGSGGVSDQELITTTSSNLTPTKATLLNPPATFGSNTYILDPYITDATPFLQKFIYTQGSNYGFSVTDVSRAGISNTVNYTQGTSIQEIKYIWTSNSWTPLGATPVTVKSDKVTLYNAINLDYRDIQTNDTVAANRVVFSCSLFNGLYMLSGKINIQVLDSMIPIDAGNWASIDLYQASTDGWPTSTILKTQQISGDPSQLVCFNFYVDGTNSTGFNYVIVLTGNGHNLRIYSSQTSLDIVPVTTARGMGVDDKTTVRRAIQINPTRSVQTVTTNGTYIFTVNMTGQFTAVATNVDLYINGTKYVYKTDTIKDYDVIANYSSLTDITVFTITLTSPTFIGDIVEIAVYPTVVSQDYFTTGNFYQTAIATSLPWMNVQGGGVRYSGSRVVIDGDVFIKGNLFGGCNTNGFFSGAQLPYDNISISSNIIGTINIADGSVTPSKLNLWGTEKVGIGTSSPSQLLHVAGNMRLDGSIYNSSNQLMWVPVNTVYWQNSVTTPPTFTIPAIGGFNYSASNGQYRWLGNEIIYNINISGTLLSTQTLDFKMTIPTPVAIASYPVNSIVGNLYLSVINGVNSNNFMAVARTNTADVNNLTIRALTGTSEESLATITTGSIITLNGTVTYITSSYNTNTAAPVTYVPPKFGQDQYGQVVLNNTSNNVFPRGLLDIYQNSNVPALVVDQIGTGDLVQIRKNGTSQIVVNNAGYLGVGNASPANPVHITAGASNIVVAASGYVGIGTATPLYNLHVNGNISASIPFMTGLPIGKISAANTGALATWPNFNKIFTTSVVESINRGGIYNSVSNRFIIPINGIYHITFTVSFVTPTQASRYSYVTVARNLTSPYTSTNVSNIANKLVFTSVNMYAQYVYATAVGSSYVNLVAGDYLECFSSGDGNGSHYNSTDSIQEMSVTLVTALP